MSSLLLPCSRCRPWFSASTTRASSSLPTRRCSTPRFRVRRRLATVLRASVVRSPPLSSCTTSSSQWSGTWVSSPLKVQRPPLHGRRPSSYTATRRALAGEARITVPRSGHGSLLRPLLLLFLRLATRGLAIRISPLTRRFLYGASILLHKLLDTIQLSVYIHTLLFFLFLLLIALWLRFLRPHPLRRRIKRRATIGFNKLRKIIGLPILFVYSLWGIEICQRWVEFSTAAITGNRFRNHQWHFTGGTHIGRVDARIIGFSINAYVFGFYASKLVLPNREFYSRIRFKVRTSPNLLATEK